MKQQFPACAICGDVLEYIDHCQTCDDNEAKQADKDQQSINNYEDEKGEI